MGHGSLSSGHTFLVMLALIAVFVSDSHGHSFVPKNLDQLVAEAEQIFVGTVTAQLPRKLATGLIVTDVEFGSLRIVKGTTVGSIVLEITGGTIGDTTLKVPGWPEFQ